MTLRRLTCRILGHRTLTLAVHFIQDVDGTRYPYLALTCARCTP